MNALTDYRNARAQQHAAEVAAQQAQVEADAALLRLREELGSDGRPAGRVRIAKVTGDSASSVGKRLDRALKGYPRPRGGSGRTRRNGPDAAEQISEP